MAVSMNIQLRPANEIEQTLGKFSKAPTLNLGTKDFAVGIRTDANIRGFVFDVQFGELRSGMEPVCLMSVARVGEPTRPPEQKDWVVKVERNDEEHHTKFNCVGDGYIVEGNFKDSVVALRDFYKTQTDGSRTLEVHMMQRR